MANKTTRKYKILALLVLYIGVVTTLSLIKISDDTELPKIENFDKLVHFCFYFGFSFLMLTTILVFSTIRNIKYEILAILLSLFYGMFIEYMQSLVGRSFDVKDIIANGTGAVMGYLFYRIPFVQSIIGRI